MIFPTSAGHTPTCEEAIFATALLYISIINYNICFVNGFFKTFISAVFS